MAGEETELDKTLIEAIANPLTHLVRNCLDHGIETSEVRLAKGKPPVGKLLLRAYHESGQVNIEISDDGGGIDPDRIRSKAVQKGMFSAVDGAKMSDREALNLIFMPSFSTAEKLLISPVGEWGWMWYRQILKKLAARSTFTVKWVKARLLN